VAGSQESFRCRVRGWKACVEEQFENIWLTVDTISFASLLTVHMKRNPVPDRDTTGNRMEGRNEPPSNRTGEYYSQMGKWIKVGVVAQCASPLSHLGPRSPAQNATILVMLERSCRDTKARHDPRGKEHGEQVKISSGSEMPNKFHRRSTQRRTHS
jgi:hypothetical protein